MSTRMLVLLFLLFVHPLADAALVSRLGGQAYYDTELDITWLADANLAASNTFGVSGIQSDGSMDWMKAQEWIAAMNSANYLGLNDWRLPTLQPVDGIEFNTLFSYDGSTDDSYSLSAPGTIYAGGTASELAHLYYNTLGNSAYQLSADTYSGCPEIFIAGWIPNCLTNADPFSNLDRTLLLGNKYWTDSEYPVMTFAAWTFNFQLGLQGDTPKGYYFYAWAVHDGDIAPVPLPSSLWLLLSGIVLLRRLNR